MRIQTLLRKGLSFLFSDSKWAKNLNVFKQRRFLKCLNINFPHLIIVSQMEAQQQLTLLPRRPTSAAYKLEASRGKSYISNYYPISPKNMPTQLHQYVLQSEPQIPADSKEIISEVINSIRKELRKTIGYYTYSNAIIWGTLNSNLPAIFDSKFRWEENEYQFKILLKHTKTIELKSIQKNELGQKVLFQLINSQIKQIFRQLHMDELSRGKYFDKKVVENYEIQLNVIRGYRATLCMRASSMLMIQIDPCTRVARKLNLLQEIQHAKNKDFMETLVDRQVLTNYGKRRIYKIVRMRKDLTPMSPLIENFTNEEMNYSEYYLKKYGLNISSKNQPLVEVVTKVEKPLRKDKTLEEKKTFGFLIPEFISLTGLNQDQKNDYNVMKKLTPYTKMPPKQRIKEVDRLVQILNQSEKVSVGEPQPVKTYQLQHPQIKLGNTNLKGNDGGYFTVRDKLKKTLQLKNWILVYSQNKHTEMQDRRDVDFLLEELNFVSKGFGIKVREPSHVVCDGSLESWRESITTAVQKYPECQIIVPFLNIIEEKLYPDIKRFITCTKTLQKQSQVIRRRSLKDKKRAVAVLSKTLIQINQKIGGTAWVVKSPLTKSFGKSVAQGAFAISKGKKGFTLSFAGSTDKNITQFRTYCKVGYKSKERFPDQDLQNIFEGWIQKYYKNNFSQLPESLLIFRQGLPIPQIHRQVKQEVQILHKVVNKVKCKTKKEWIPNINYVIINTKINSRFFEMPYGSDHPINPAPGTVVFENFTSDDIYDFHLTPQKTTEGSCSPIRCIVAYSNSQVSQEELSQYIYSQCFNYYNWTGTVKVPATLQYANKLAKHVGQSIQENVTSDALMNSFYYL